MIKTPPSPLRLAGLIGFVLACVLVLTYLWISFGGSIPFAAQGYRIEVAFPQANELAGGADVRAPASAPVETINRNNPQCARSRRRFSQSQVRR